MKFISWNVNGLRSVHRRDFLKWLGDEKPDFACLQEIKISEEQAFEEAHFKNPHKYGSHWHFAEKPGYSGLVIYSRKDPEAIRQGLGQPLFDREARWLEADFAGGLTLINTYFPNSQREHERLPYKLKFCRAAEKRLEALRAQGRRVLLCGDLNIAHKEIDLKNPKSNKDNAGFLPEERAWMDRITGLGWVDTFRHFEKGPEHYTWWSYRPGVRERNIGWRLDYFLTNPEAVDRLKTVEHLTKIYGSDHCPVRLVLKR